MLMILVTQAYPGGSCKKQFHSVGNSVWISGNEQSMPPHNFTRIWVSTQLKNISQLGSFPQVGMKIKKIYLKPPPSHNWGIQRERNPCISDKHFFSVISRNREHKILWMVRFSAPSPVSKHFSKGFLFKFSNFIISLKTKPKMSQGFYLQ